MSGTSVTETVPTDSVVTNDTDIALPMNYVVLNTTVAVLYLLLVIAPSLVLNVFILHFYHTTKSFQTPLNLILANYCIAAIFRTISKAIALFMGVPVSLKEGSCLGAWLYFGLNINHILLITLLIALFSLTQCSTIFCPNVITRKKVRIVLVFLWIFSFLCGLLTVVLWAEVQLSYYYCNIVDTGIDFSNPVINIVAFSYAFVALFVCELPPLFIVCISSTTACCKYDTALIRSNPSLTRRMMLLPVVTTVSVTITGTFQKYNRVILSLALTEEQNTTTGIIAVALFLPLLFEFCAGPVFSVMLLYLNVPLKNHFKNVLRNKLFKRRNRVQPMELEQLQAEREQQVSASKNNNIHFV